MHYIEYQNISAILRSDYIMGALNEGDCGESPDYISIEG